MTILWLALPNLCCQIDLSTTAHLPHHHVTMNCEAHSDIDRWLRLLLPWNGHAIIPDPHGTRAPNLELFTDASGSIGYGMFYAGCWIADPWPPESINPMERALPHCSLGLLLGDQWSGVKLLFHCDNQAVVDIWASGSSRDPLTMHLADSTRRSYQAGIQRYSGFCASRGWQSFPASWTTLPFFAPFLADQDFYKTIKLYMTGLSFIYTENSILNPFSSALHLHLFLRGIKHTMGLSSHQHLPVTMSLLRQIKEEVSHAPDFLPSDKLMLWLAFTLAFYNFQQSSEFTSPSASQFNPLVHLCATDISFTSNGCLAMHLK